MSSLRWAPLLGLVVIVFLLPGALAHHCTPPDQNSGQFNTQSTTVSSSGPLLIGLLVGVPLVVGGVALAAFRASPSAAAPVQGRWVCTPTQWVWVPEKK